MMSHASPAGAEPATLATIRRLLIGTLLIGALGMGVELLFIGHVEDPWQLVPIALLAAGAVVVVWHATAPNSTSVQALRVVMLACVASGGLGVLLHYRGNEAFELEMYPSRSGLELVRETLTGATPVLAPGSMTLLGLVGLVVTYRYPLRSGDRKAGDREVPS